MSNLITRTSNSLKHINNIKFISKLNTNKNKIFMKLTLSKGNILNTKSQNIAILLNPIKSYYYDNEIAKLVLEQAGMNLINEIQEIKKTNPTEVKISSILVTGTGNIKNHNRNISNILHVIGKNEFNEYNKIQCEQILNHYKNLFSKLKEIEQTRIAFSPLVELSYSISNIKCADIFFQEFLQYLILKNITLLSESNLKNIELKSESIGSVFSGLSVFFRIIRTKKLTSNDFDILYRVFKLMISYKKNKNIDDNKSYYDIEMIFPNENQELFHLYSNQLNVFLEKLNLVLSEDNETGSFNSYLINKKYSSMMNKDLLVEISQDVIK